MPRFIALWTPAGLLLTSGFQEFGVPEISALIVVAAWVWLMRRVQHLWTETCLELDERLTTYT